MSDVAVQEPNRVSFKGWLPAQEAADHLGVSREYIYRLKSLYEEGNAGVPGFMLGDKSHVLMFRVSDLDAYKASHPLLGSGRPGNTEEAKPDSGALTPVGAGAS